MIWLLVVALVVGLLGWLLVVLSTRRREGRGLGPGETVALDDVTLFSERLLLIGRPDRLVRTEDGLIPEEWKGSQRVHPSHQAQLGTYFLLVEEKYGERPPYGVAVLSDGRRVRVENTEELRSEVLAVAAKVREQRRKLKEEIPVSQLAWKCRACGQRGNCRQAQN
jgi:CRISPR-associated exonuclease Cas4